MLGCLSLYCKELVQSCKGSMAKSHSPPPPPGRPEEKKTVQEAEGLPVPELEDSSSRSLRWAYLHMLEVTSTACPDSIGPLLSRPPLQSETGGLNMAYLPFDLSVCVLFLSGTHLSLPAGASNHQMRSLRMPL